MSAGLSKFVKKEYPDYKSDLFSACMVRFMDLAKKDGYLGFLSPYVWMFIASYEKLRKLFIEAKTIESLIQFEYSAFEEATVPICTFVLKNGFSKKKGAYLRLVDYRGGMEVQRQKALQAIDTHDINMFYEASASNFRKIPGTPIAYWWSERFFRIFDNEKIGKDAISDGQTKTGDNDKYLRLLWEVSTSDIGKENKWVIHLKGGSYRRWYGNIDTLIDWSEPARNHYKKDRVARIAPEYIWFRKGLSWTLISSSDKFGVRFLPDYATFNLAAPSIFFDDDDELYYVLGFLNTVISEKIMRALNPTLNTNISDITSQPLIVDEKYKKEVIDSVVENINTSKEDWDSNETSWDFNKHPLLNDSNNLSNAYTLYKERDNERFDKLKSKEEELNRIFIEIYGLGDELTPEVADKDVTVARIYDTKEEIPDSMKGNNYVLTKEDVIKSFISYAVGCMFGRYSLDVEGLAYAGGDWDASKYKTFLPDKDAIIPICDDEYFEDDIVGRFVQFVEVVYGKDTLEENLQFIADALGGKGTSREVIRNYFVSSFYADHVKTYKKRPIYWLFDSGKKNGFKCLIYMHRYQPDTLARIRTDYIHEQQSRYRTVIESLEQRIAAAGSSSEKVKITKLLNTRQAQAKEIREYEEKVHHLADQMIKIDLDDGVKHNYAIFKDVLAKIK